MVSFHTETKVFFANHSDEFLKKYVEEGDGSDKAGGYGIQEHVSSSSEFPLDILKLDIGMAKATSVDILWRYQKEPILWIEKYH